MASCVTCVAAERHIQYRFFSPFATGVFFIFYSTKWCFYATVDWWVSSVGFVFFSLGSTWNDLSRKQFHTFSVAERKHGKPSENGETVLPLFCHCFTWNTNILQETRTVKRAKLQQFSTVDCNLIGFCFGADTIGSNKKSFTGLGL